MNLAFYVIVEANSACQTTIMMSQKLQENNRATKRKALQIDEQTISARCSTTCVYKRSVTSPWFTKESFLTERFCGISQIPRTNRWSVV